MVKIRIQAMYIRQFKDVKIRHKEKKKIKDFNAIQSISYITEDGSCVELKNSLTRPEMSEHVHQKDPHTLVIYKKNEIELIKNFLDIIRKTRPHVCISFYNDGVTSVDMWNLIQSRAGPLGLDLGNILGPEHVEVLFDEKYFSGGLELDSDDFPDLQLVEPSPPPIPQWNRHPPTTFSPLASLF